MSGLEKRCSNGRPCEEVSARLVAGHLAKYLEGHADCGEQLLATAARIAELHYHGSPVELEEAS